MQRTKDRPAAKTEHSSTAPNIGRLSWDDIRLFLACVNEGSFRQAARALNLSNSTIVRRIERLETAFGRRLFVRLPGGVVPTYEGEMLLKGAGKMESAVYDILRHQMDVDGEARGIVTISATEGLGSYWVTPKLVDFQRQVPQLVVRLISAMESVDVLRLEADMAVQYDRPTNPDLILVKLGRLHLYPFAAKEYLDRYGCPSSIADMAHHRLILQSAPQVDPNIWCEKLGLKNLEGVAQMVTNSSNALFYAVEKGAGIGALPTYAAPLGAPVIPVDVEIKHHMDIWLTYHPDIKKSPSKALMIDFLKRIFDPHIYPWFRDEFIHPNDLIEAMPKEAKVNMGRGYFSVTPF